MISNPPAYPAVQRIRWSRSARLGAPAAALTQSLAANEGVPVLLVQERGCRPVAGHRRVDVGDAPYLYAETATTDRRRLGALTNVTQADPLHHIIGDAADDPTGASRTVRLSEWRLNRCSQPG